MELNKTKSSFYILISFSVMMILLLGSWWLYLVFKLANKLEDLNHPLLEGNLVSMIKWEGLSFFFLLLILTFTLLYVYFQDHKKTKALQAFFASLTHELKTPLAGMKLQSEVLSDLIQEDQEISPSHKSHLLKYTERLTHDSIRLENQLDNHLQLSRLERKAPLNLRMIPAKSFIINEISRLHNQINFNLDQLDPKILLYADDFALKTILRNLFENTLTHSQQNLPQVSIYNKGKTLTYQEKGSSFQGSAKHLGELFYKHNSPKGSGIGLYLIKKLMLQMNGVVFFHTQNNFTIELEFQRSEISS
jgi:signal transduction histidine kinase